MYRVHIVETAYWQSCKSIFVERPGQKLPCDIAHTQTLSNTLRQDGVTAVLTFWWSHILSILGVSQSAIPPHKSVWSWYTSSLSPSQSETRRLRKPLSTTNGTAMGARNESLWIQYAVQFRYGCTTLLKLSQASEAPWFMMRSIFSESSSWSRIECQKYIVDLGCCRPVLIYN